MGSQDGGFMTVSLLAYSPGLIIAHVHTWLLAIIHEPWWMVFGWLWFVFVCGWLSSFVGGQLHFLGGRGSRADVSCGWHWVLCHGCHQRCHWVVVGGWLKGMDVTHCDIWIMFKFTCEIITCMISCDDLRLVPWISLFFFFTELGWTLYGITRHNNTNPIPIIFHADSTRMSNSMISPAEFQDSSQILGGIPGVE